MACCARPMRSRPTLTPNATLASLLFFGAVYVLIFSFGTLFIYRLLRAGPTPASHSVEPSNAKRPLAMADAEDTR